MYYNSNTDNYYNSYKKELLELEAYRKEENTQKIIKRVLLSLALVLFFAAAFYLYKYFNPLEDVKKSFLQNEKISSKTNHLPRIVIREEELPLSIQLHESSMNIAQNIKNNATDTSLKNQKAVSVMTEKDIKLIVQIIMSQMNTKVEKSLEVQLKEANKKNFVSKSLEQTNHYNKIILTKNEITEVKNASLMELSNNLNEIINEEIDSKSNYAQEITKEVHFRKNEMRIIIVQKGDTLSRIAKKAYGDYDDYPKIFAANPEIIKNPNQIFVGQRLRIPS